MKKITITFLSLIFLTIGCSEEFTDIDSIGTLSNAQLANKKGVNLLLTGAYSVLDGIRQNSQGNEWGRSADNWVADVISDDAHKGSTDSDQADLFSLEMYNWSTGNGYFLARWSVLYAGVNRANAVIKLISSSDNPSDFDEQHAQARFLRGHFNFELVKTFGKVPLITLDNYAAQEFNQPNAEISDIYAAIEADFTYAKSILPSSYSGAYTQRGRPLSWAAQAFLGKAQLFQGNFSDAKTNLEAVINSGEYALHPNQVDNFMSASENGVEAIFAIQYSADDAQSKQGNATGALNYTIGVGGWCCGFYQPTQDLVDAYKTSGGLPQLDTFQDTHVTTDFRIAGDAAFTPYSGKLDPRLDFTVGRRGIDYNGYGVMGGKEWVRASFDDISGPYLAKKNVFTNGDDANAGVGGWGQNLSGLNYHIMRYADVILMAAEANVELNNLPAAQALVNQIRTRAKNMDTVKDADLNDAADYDIALYTTPWTDQADARKAVRFERRLELAMEGHRTFDLRRWGVAETVMAKYISKEGETIIPFAKGQTFQSKHTLFPIPLSAIDGSGGVITQNPGF
ncbi:MAG: RagB/SusD family nutrient uptake outer membrane protein [Flavobacteriales bacterium]